MATRALYLSNAALAALFAVAFAVLALAPGTVERHARAAVVERIAEATFERYPELMAAHFYVFRQDWLQTVLFADYVGYTYLAWVAVLASLLVDAVFNRGRGLEAVLSSFAV